MIEIDRLILVFVIIAILLIFIFLISFSGLFALILGDLMALDATQLQALRDEIDNNPQGLNIVGAAPRIIRRELVTPGSSSNSNPIINEFGAPTELWRILGALERPDYVSLHDYLETDPATLTDQDEIDDFKFIKCYLDLHSKIGTVDTSNPTYINWVNQLRQRTGVNQADANQMKAFGEVQQSRSEELFNVKITISDVEGALAL